MRDLFHEIYESMKRNKLRTCLTGFAVAWGIFMLIVLLGAGNGIMNAFSEQSTAFASNTIMFGGNYTSMPYDGLKAGRRITLQDKDLEILYSKQFEDIVDAVSPTIYTSVQARYEKKSFVLELQGDYPSIAYMNRYQLLGGRFINESDLRNRKKVVVLPSDIAERLLPDGVDATTLIGKRIRMDNFMFLVVGIIKPDEMSDSSLAIAPFTTTRMIFTETVGSYINHISFSFHGLKTMKDSDAFEEKLRTVINSLHRAAPEDTRTIWIWNRFSQNLQMQKATDMLDISLWLIGLFTLLSGVVGVSNIMLISVKERTHEFGIRKAIGAKPWSILRLIISESVIITAIFGYIGMFLGLLTCEILDKTIGQQSMEFMGGEVSLLVNPTVGLDIAIEATMVLIVAGTLAGMFPAMKASKVRPIEALRAE